MQNYNFQVTVTTATAPAPAVPTTPDKPNIPTAPDTTESSGGLTIGQEVAQAATKRLTGVVEQQALAPLNQVTGGMAAPVYNVAKNVISGAGAGAITGAAIGAIISGIQLAISKIQERIAKNEAKAAELNERDNLLIKAGAKTTATFYSGSFNGVKSTERKY